MSAADVGGTAIECAGFAVVTVENAPGTALTALAMVIDGAGVVVRAVSTVGLVDAAEVGVAEVFGAGVAVVAAKRIATGALPSGAEVFGSADVTVVARGCVGQVDTARFGFAAVVGARVAVVTVRGDAASASPLLAALADGAGGAIVAGEARVGRDDAAGTGCGSAECGQAESIRACWSGALHHRFGHDFAEMG